MFLKMSYMFFVFLMFYGLNCFGQSADAEIDIRVRVRIGEGTPQQATPSPPQNQTRGTIIDGVEFFEYEVLLFSNGKSYKDYGTKFINHNNYRVRVNVGSLLRLDLAPREERGLGSWKFQMVNSSEIRVTRL
jgi:hypothetical protein